MERMNLNLLFVSGEVFNVEFYKAFPTFFFKTTITAVNTTTLTFVLFRNAVEGEKRALLW